MLLSSRPYDQRALKVERMKHHAVLFDLDGTLLDTLADLADSMNAVLAEMGFPQHPRVDYRGFVGDGVRALGVRALPAGRRDDDTVDDALERMQVEYAKRWDNTTRPYPGVGELLDGLAGRGVKCAVLSNKPDEYTRLCVSRFLPDWRFEVVQGVSDGIAPKPDPGGALAISERLAVPPEQMLYLGDTDTDMQTAVAAGMFAVGAAWGFRTPRELREHGAAAIIDRPPDLLAML